MKTLLWVNACMRGAGVSRTYDLCQAFLTAWTAAHPDGRVVQRDLTEAQLPILTAQLTRKRDAVMAAGELDAPLLAAAREFAAADEILIGAPYWDLAFPAALKVYLEWVSTLGITFHYTEQGSCEGLCRAEHLLYVTTSGGVIGERNFGFDYVRGLSGMLGIDRTQCVAAEQLDVQGGPGEEQLRLAREQLCALAKTW